MDQFGSDFLVVVDENGNESELEVLSTLDYNGCTYLAVIPVETCTDHPEFEVGVLKVTEEDGESILSIIEDDAELEAVYDILMESLYEEDDAET